MQAKDIDGVWWCKPRQTPLWGLVYGFPLIKYLFTCMFCFYIKLQQNNLIARWWCDFHDSLIELLLPAGLTISSHFFMLFLSCRAMYSMRSQSREWDLLWGKERRCGKTDTSCLPSLSPQHQHLATNPGWCHSVGHHGSHDPHQSPTEVPQVSQNALLSGWLSPSRSLTQDGIYGMSEGHRQLLLKPGGFTGISALKRYKAPMAD